MFENLQDRLSGSLRKISGQARLTDDNIKDTLREVRMALLEADVALPVVKDFVEGVRKRAIGQNANGREERNILQRGVDEDVHDRRRRGERARGP